MLPFHVDFLPGSPWYEQIVYAVTKAIISGQLRSGDEFSSPRVLRRHLKINPNTAHKVMTCLVDAGLLEIRPGSVAVVAKRPAAIKAEKRTLLQHEIEQLVVEAKRLGIELSDVEDAIAMHWSRLSAKRERKPEASKGGR
jgi:DNA-binding transcriptional regulator YhcF (GntR family)